MNNCELKSVLVNQIDDSGGRELDLSSVQNIASSIDLLGLQSPISVTLLADGKFRIISGRHRLQAMRSLGREEIDAFVYNGLSAIDLQLAEIVENLHRAELTALERSEQIARYAKLAAEKRQQGGGQVGQDPSNIKGASGRERGYSAAARGLGLDRKKVRRAGKIAEIEPAAKKAAKESGLDDNQSVLLKVAAAPKGEQLSTLTAIAAQKAEKRPATDGVRATVQEIVKKILAEFEPTDIRLIVKELSKAVNEGTSSANETDPVATPAEVPSMGGGIHYTSLKDILIEELNLPQ